MAKLVTISDQLVSELHEKEHPTRYCEELEAGNILFFPTCPFPFSEDSLAFLRAQKQTSSSHRKNIAYKPSVNKITNAQASAEQEEKLLKVMRDYSTSVTAFLSTLLSPYVSSWRLDYASFRPFQEMGRQLRIRARNDLLHVDAFPSRPMHGNRILRFFTNINPKEGRFWTTSEPFPTLAAKFGGKEVPFPDGVTGSPLETFGSYLRKKGKKLGLPFTLRSPYDSFMLALHNFLKESTEFQQTCPKDYFEFPPMSCWAVYTDLVSHAATSGQYALEQTFIIPSHAMVHPEKAPLRVLEKLARHPMVNPTFV